MAAYKLTPGGGVMRTADSVSIPEGSRLYGEYQAWLAVPNTPDPADVPSAEQLALEVAVVDAPIGARDWFTSNPSAKLIWSMTVAEVVAEIATLIETTFPAPATAATRTKWKLLVTAIVLALRVLVKREGLD